MGFRLKHSKLSLLQYGLYGLVCGSFDMAVQFGACLPARGGLYNTTAARGSPARRSSGPTRTAAAPARGGGCASGDARGQLLSAVAQASTGAHSGGAAGLRRQVQVTATRLGGTGLLYIREPGRKSPVAKWQREERGCRRWAQRESQTGWTRN